MVSLKVLVASMVRVVVVAEMILEVCQWTCWCWWF